MTILEVITFPPAEDYQKDPVAALSPFLTILAGSSSIDTSTDYFYHGLRIDDKDMGQVVIPWLSVEAFQSFVSGPSSKDVKSTFGQIVDPEKISKVSLKLFEFADPLGTVKPILSAPATEYLLLEAKSRELSDETSKRLSALAAAVAGISGVSGVTFGKQVGEEPIFLALVKWDSVQAYKEAKLPAAFEEAKTHIVETANLLGLFHVTHSRV